MFLSQKSSEPDFFDKAILHKLDLLLKEQAQQRLDLSVINALIKHLMSDKGIQRQVDEYFERDETSPQTESDEQNDDSSN